MDINSDLTTLVAPIVGLLCGILTKTLLRPKTLSLSKCLALGVLGAMAGVVVTRWILFQYFDSVVRGIVAYILASTIGAIGFMLLFYFNDVKHQNH